MEWFMIGLYATILVFIPVVFCICDELEDRERRK